MEHRNDAILESSNQEAAPWEWTIMPCDTDVTTIVTIAVRVSLERMPSSALVDSDHSAPPKRQFSSTHRRSLGNSRCMAALACLRRIRFMRQV